MPRDSTLHIVICTKCIGANIHYTAVFRTKFTSKFQSRTQFTTTFKELATFINWFYSGDAQNIFPSIDDTQRKRFMVDNFYVGLLTTCASLGNRFYDVQNILGFESQLDTQHVNCFAKFEKRTNQTHIQTNTYARSMIAHLMNTNRSKVFLINSHTGNYRFVLLNVLIATQHHVRIREMFS